MFERTVSFWRRLVSRRSASSADTTVQEDERRAWQRVPAEIATVVQPISDSNPKPVPATIHNVSLGGVLLTLNRAFTEGDLISVELPGVTEQERSTVLACVIHVGQQPDGKWAVGCTFSRELSEEDLNAFGAQRKRHPPSDQRTWMRFRCDMTATCQVVASPETPPFAAQVLDISASGVGLQVRQEVANGTLLSVELLAGHSNFKRTMLACVVHVNAQSDGVWALGCNFIRSLSEADLKALA
jgi:hypothetical protein